MSDKKFAYVVLQTEYKGHMFRSRIEARWAVFFDTMRLPWEYESHGFEIEGTRYLPDFQVQLTTGRVWFEVKGDAPTPVEIEKARKLAKATNRGVLIAFGNFSSGHPPFPVPVMVGVRPDGSMDGLYEWWHCSTCDRVGFKKIGQDFDGCSCTYPYKSSILENAYRAARGSRFGT